VDENMNSLGEVLVNFLLFLPKMTLTRLALLIAPLVLPWILMRVLFRFCAKDDAREE